MKFGEIRSTINMKQVLKIAGIALVALGVSVGLWLYLNGYLTKSKASTTDAKLSFSETTKKAKGGETVKVGLLVTTETGMSGVDVTFETTGTNLNFLYAQSTSQLPVGFDERVLTENMTTTQTAQGTKVLRRMMLVSKKPAVQLPKSLFIPLYFAVINNGQTTAKSSISVNLSSSQVSGPAVPGNLFTLLGNRKPLDFTVEVDDARAAAATNLFCDSICGTATILKWTDSANEDGYTILKDGQQLAKLGENTQAYPHTWCGDFNTHTYAVIAYNVRGSVSTTEPSIKCACQRCPTPAPPTPTPVQPTNSSDLIFRLQFPDVDSTVSQLADVKITILGDGGERVCLDDTDCAFTVPFTRMGTSNYFSSPQLQYNLNKTIPYSLVVKHPHTVRRTYKHVFLKWRHVLTCLGNASESGCGELVSEIDKKPMYSGDMQGLDITAEGYNIIDSMDLTAVGAIADSQKLSNIKSSEGDMNFDGSTDVKDYGIVARNLGKKGN